MTTARRSSGALRSIGSLSMIERADVDFQSLYMRFYFDEDVSVDIAANLQQRGFDVLTVRDAGRLQLDDATQLAFTCLHPL